LGDFKYKKNLSMTPEEQIVTANPDVSVRDITEEDEFLVIACDGKILTTAKNQVYLISSFNTKVSGTV